MLSKILSYLIGFVILLLIFGIGLQYYISRPIEHNELICFKGKLLARVGDDGAIYTKVKKFTCEYKNDMLILEEE